MVTVNNIKLDISEVLDILSTTITNEQIYQEEQCTTSIMNNEDDKLIDNVVARNCLHGVL